ncbi:unnamed protein product [Toxocara canis]|uniref:BZIP domain-containing protein n=2 Tax=Toxocara canis TaxID=6265 RepID=A0A183U4F9_TOXCA|nr:unnamed protein product [Toxocara canis]
MWRYDERMEKNINPESWDEQPGDEETSDENYTVVQPRRYNVKRRTARRTNKDVKVARRQWANAVE